MADTITAMVGEGGGNAMCGRGTGTATCASPLERVRAVAVRAIAVRAIAVGPDGWANAAVR